MIRPFTALCVLLAAGSGLYLYQEKHRAQLLDREIAATVHAADQARERSGILRAEWQLLNDPERLAQLSARFLALKTMTPGQFTSMAELDARLPAVRPPDAPPAQTDTDPGDSTPAPVAEAPAGPPPAPPVAAPPPKPVIAAARPAERPVEHPAERKIAVAQPVIPGYHPFHSETRVETRPLVEPTLASTAPRPIPLLPPLTPRGAPAQSDAGVPVMSSALGMTRTVMRPPVPFGSGGSPAEMNGN